MIFHIYADCKTVKELSFNEWVKRKKAYPKARFLFVHRDGFSFHGYISKRQFFLALTKIKEQWRE